MKRQRLDKALVERDIARSRSHAKELIGEGRVLVGGFPADKASTLVEHNDHIELEGDEFPWVGRGGKKMWPFLEREWGNVDDRICLDVGASTGGFTQALLRAGASRVFAVDVGYGQLDYKLRQDDRVTVIDRYNFRHADPGDFSPSPEFFTMDVSFISTLKLLDALNEVTTENARGLCLLKPQFEAGPDENEQGIVTDLDVVIDVLSDVFDGWDKEGWGIEAVSPSPVTGQEGNQEYVVKFVRGSASKPDRRDIVSLVREGEEWITGDVSSTIEHAGEQIGEEN